MAVYKRKLPALTPIESIVVPKEYWGLKAIAYRMSCSIPKLKKLATKYGFPLLRLPANCTRGWSYYSSEDLLVLWKLGLIEHTKRYLLEYKHTGTSKIREHEAPSNPIRQVLENKALSSIQESSFEHGAGTSTTETSSTKDNESSSSSLVE